MASVSYLTTRHGSWMPACHGGGMAASVATMVWNGETTLR